MVISEYGSIFSIVLFGYLLVPAVILGLLEKRITYYGIIISIPALYLLIGSKWIYFVGFIAYEVFLIYLYFYGKRHFKSKYFYYFVIVLSILPIAYVKSLYLTHLKVISILGISYMCFRIWQIIIEIHDEHIQRLDLVYLLYFITFFPTLSSGPIDRFNRFIEDAKKKIVRQEYMDNYLVIGIQKIFWGLIYKFGVANLINLYMLSKISKTLTFISGIEYMYVYTLYLFFDFAGYSNLAIGTSYILGIKAPENFNKPFLAKNMKEFWERWHMSLSKWFGDYIFSRFVLNVMRNRWIHKRSTAARVGFMVTMTTMGIWHGLTIYYILYGLYQGIALALTDKYLKSKAHRRHLKSPHYTLISRIICFHTVAFGLLLFSGYLIRF